MRITRLNLFSLLPFGRGLFLAFGMALVTTGTTSQCCAQVSAKSQSNAGFFTDPATGIVYRKVTRTIEKPVVETKMTQRQQTIYKPKTVTESRPTIRRMYVPTTEHRWVPQVEGRWNPFVQPRVAYKHLPETRWQVRDEVISEVKTEVKWEPETQTVNVPEQSLRMTREQVVDFEPVGRVAPGGSNQSAASPQAVASTSNIPPDVAARLRPMDPSRPMEPVARFGTPSANESLAATERGKYRSNLQTGLRATELMPANSPTYVPPTGSNSTIGIAGLPGMRIWR